MLDGGGVGSGGATAAAARLVDALAAVGAKHLDN